MFDFKAFRKSRGLTQKEMAEIIGLSQASYSRIETGDFIPSEEKCKEYIQNIQKIFPSVREDSFVKKESETVAITQKNVLGANYIGRLEKQSDEDRLNLQQIVETLRNELEEKNAQIREKDTQISSLLAIIANLK